MLLLFNFFLLVTNECITTYGMKQIQQNMYRYIKYYSDNNYNYQT